MKRLPLTLFALVIALFMITPEVFGCGGGMGLFGRLKAKRAMNMGYGYGMSSSYMYSSGYAMHSGPVMYSQPPIIYKTIVVPHGMKSIEPDPIPVPPQPMIPKVTTPTPDFVSTKAKELIACIDQTNAVAKATTELVSTLSEDDAVAKATSTLVSTITPSPGNDPVDNAVTQLVAFHPK